MNKDRGMIKWAPFNSVVSNKEIISSILKEKKKIKMPLLSDDEKLLIEKKLIQSFYTNEKIKLNYFYMGSIYTLNERIIKIDFIYHKIYFENHFLIFDQIIKIY